MIRRPPKSTLFPSTPLFRSLYLVCHGALVQGEPRLWLEDETGQVGVTAGTELVTRLAELSRRPRLVVLASCQRDRKSTRLNSSHANISYAVFCLKKKKNNNL